MVIINGLRAIENLVTTVPLDILVTPARPDIVFVNKNNSITISLNLPSPLMPKNHLTKLILLSQKVWRFSLWIGIQRSSHKFFGSGDWYAGALFSKIYLTLPSSSSHDCKVCIWPQNPFGQVGKANNLASHKIFLSRNVSTCMFFAATPEPQLTKLFIYFPRPCQVHFIVSWDLVCPRAFTFHHFIPLLYILCILCCRFKEKLVSPPYTLLYDVFPILGHGAIKFTEIMVQLL